MCEVSKTPSLLAVTPDRGAVRDQGQGPIFWGDMASILTVVATPCASSGYLGALLPQAVPCLGT